MCSLRSLLASLLLLTALPSAAKELAYYDSLRLVSAMREDERLLLAVRAAKSQRKQLSAQDGECLDRYEYFELTDIPARQILDKLTAADVEEALSYFQSASGRKFVRRELTPTEKVSSSTQDWSAAEQAELDTFKQRPVGRKLLRDNVLRSAAAMEQVTDRVNHHLENCAYDRQSEAQWQPTKTCRSRGVASPDNVCLATYAATGTGPTRRATVDIVCRKSGGATTSQISMPNPEAPVALRWSKDREIEILIDNTMRVGSSSVPADFSPRFRFVARRPADPAPLECLPERVRHSSLAHHLPLGVAVGAWRAHRQSGLCLMTTRVPKEDVAGADGDMLLQFRRQKPAVLPYATTGLAFVVQIYQMKGERPLLLDLEQSRLQLIEQSSQPQYLLTGKATDALLQDLKSKPAELEVQHQGQHVYSIPVRRQDFDFAYAEFAECLAQLNAT
jgi:hypothetical protein